MWPIISLYQTMQNRSKASKLYVSNHSGLRLWSDDIFFDEIFFWTEILIWNNISEDFDGFQKSRPKDVSIISEIYYQHCLQYTSSAAHGISNGLTFVQDKTFLVQLSDWWKQFYY